MFIDCRIPASRERVCCMHAAIRIRACRPRATAWSYKASGLSEHANNVGRICARRLQDISTRDWLRAGDAALNLCLLRVTPEQGCTYVTVRRWAEMTGVTSCSTSLKNAACARRLDVPARSSAESKVLSCSWPRWRKRSVPPECGVGKTTMYERAEHVAPCWRVGVGLEERSCPYCMNERGQLTTLAA